MSDEENRTICFPMQLMNQEAYNYFLPYFRQWTHNFSVKEVKNPWDKKLNKIIYERNVSKEAIENRRLEEMAKIPGYPITVEKRIISKPDEEFKEIAERMIKKWEESKRKT